MIQLSPRSLHKQHKRSVIHLGDNLTCCNNWWYRHGNFKKWAYFSNDNIEILTLSTLEVHAHYALQFIYIYSMLTWLKRCTQYSRWPSLTWTLLRYRNTTTVDHCVTPWATATSSPKGLNRGTLQKFLKKPVTNQQKNFAKVTSCTNWPSA